MITDDIKYPDETYIDGIVEKERLVIMGLGFYGNQIKQSVIYAEQEKISDFGDIKQPITYGPARKGKKGKTKKW